MAANRYGANKYYAQKVSIGGETFDSKKEARRWEELNLLLRAGRISDLRRQVKFVLIPAQYERYPRYGKKGQRIKDGTTCVEQACEYIADFVYIEDGKVIVEDVKGYRDPRSAAYAKFVIKRKLMLERYGVRVREV